MAVAGMPPQEEAEKHGVRVAAVGRSDPARSGQLLLQISELIEGGHIKVQVGAVFPLAEAAQAHALSQQGRTE